MRLRGSIVFLWFAVQSVQCLTTIFDLGYFGNISNALYKNVKFISERIEQLNVDGILGVTMAEAHLSAALSSPTINLLNTEQWNLLNEIKNLCDKARLDGISKLISKNEYTSMMKTFLQPDIWNQPINWWSKHLNLNATSTKNVLPRDAFSLIFHGTPQEPESDFCLEQLAADHACKLPDTCSDILHKKDGSRGYPLTHRLLIIQTARALQCTFGISTNNFSNLIDEYCNEIFIDLLDLESDSFPFISRDLAMEQITLCGMEGYREFLDKHYMDLVLSWRSPIGCYSALQFNPRNRHRRKKSTKLMDHGCDSHATGLAAATLSLFIRAYLENVNI